MKTKYLIYIFLFLLIVAFKQYSIKPLKVRLVKQIKLFQPENDLFPVFKLSKNTIALIVKLNEENTKSIFDSIYKNFISDNSEYFNFTIKPEYFTHFDTIGKYKLIRNLKLEKEIKKHLETSYFVYGTKGISKCQINEVLVGLDECKTNILAFKIDYDTLKFGNPIFSSKNKINLNYGKNYSELEMKIEDLYKTEINDYSDNIKTKVFANLDSLYFAYEDDFNWGVNPKNKKCLFPSRLIFKLQKNGSVKRNWANSLDLYGIPCD